MKNILISNQCITHHYVEGETFESIARNYGTTAEKLERLNPQFSPTNLYEGLEIIISKPPFTQEEKYIIKEFNKPARAYGAYKPLIARKLPNYMNEPPEFLNWFYQINIADELTRSGIYAIEKNGEIIVNGSAVHIQGILNVNGHVYATGWDIMNYLKKHHPYVVKFPWPTTSEVKSIMGEVNKQVKIAGEKYGIDPYLLKAIIAQESSFNPRAVSDAKAEGLMQLMPQIIRKLRINDSFDIIENIDGGAREFQECMNAFPNNLEYAIASYNGGIQPINDKIFEGRGLIDVSEETRSYVFLVLKYYSKFRLKNDLK